MCNRVLPDFRREAEMLIERHEELLESWAQFVPGREVLIDSLVALLEQEYQKGYSAGYLDGQEHGWEDILDSDQQWIEAHSRPLDEETLSRISGLVGGMDYIENEINNPLNTGRGTIPYDFEEEKEN